MMMSKEKLHITLVNCSLLCWKISIQSQSTCMPTARKALVGREGERDWEGWRGREILGGERLKKERNFTELKSFVGTYS